MTSVATHLIPVPRVKYMKVVAKACIFYVGDDLNNPLPDMEQWSVLVLNRCAGQSRPESPHGHDIPGGTVRNMKELRKYLVRQRLITKIHKETGLEISTFSLRLIDEQPLPLRPGTVSWHAAPTSCKSIEVNPYCHQSYDWVEIGKLDSANLPDWMKMMFCSGVAILHKELTAS